jgi:dihydrolipoamide dehydrogenase
MPSKLLIAAAHAAHGVAGAGRFGVRVDPGGWRVDGRAVMERVRDERDRFVGFVLRGVEELPEENLLRGRARFTGSTRLVVDDHTEVDAGAVVVAAGSSPWIQPELDRVLDRVITSDDIFDLETLPESVVVLGSGVISLELGQALHRLGVRTSILSRSQRRLGPFTDPELISASRAVFGAELEIERGGALVSARRSDGGVELVWRRADGTTVERTAEVVLAATGRTPNLDGLGLAVAGVELDQDGLPVVDPLTMQAGEGPVFLAGDVTGRRTVLHEASDEGRIAGANAAAWPDISAAVRRTPLTIAFTDPQIALVGERFVGLDPEESVVGRASYDNQGRARVMGVDAGLVRVYGRRDCGTLIGAEMLGPGVEHTAHLLGWAVQQGMTVVDALAMPFYHPAIEEGIRSALRDLAGELRMARRCPPEDCSTAPGQ